MKWNYITVDCPCGKHLVNLNDPIWQDKGIGFYSCNCCNQPLICQGDDRKLYLVGQEITY